MIVKGLQIDFYTFRLQLSMTWKTRSNEADGWLFNLHLAVIVIYTDVLHDGIRLISHLLQFKAKGSKIRIKNLYFPSASKKCG